MSAADLPREGPLFSAVSSSARQLFILLRCISFAPKAQVQISQEGLRFSVEESSVMEGLAFLDKSLFTSFHYNAPAPISPSPSASDPTSDPPTFEISLPALLETLQIFGVTETQPSRHQNAYTSSLARTTAFDTRLLGMTGVCRLHYGSPGSPLSVVLEEAGVTTTCELTTYEPSPAALEDIPFARDKLSLKVIMRAGSLYDAITELASTNSARLTLAASPTDLGAGKAGFQLSASGPLGSAVVAFEHQQGAGAAAGTDDGGSVLETFQVAGRVAYSYKFGLIRAAQRAMAVATKVSIRGDEQGVLSLQFMIEIEGGGVSFVDFRFVPLVEEGEGEGVTVRVDERGSDTEEE